jgi:hypothetical protein
VERQNVTISLPLSVLKKAKHRAVEEGSSLSGLLSAYIEQIVDDAAETDRATRRIRSRLAAGIDLGTKGSLGRTRDDVHGR